MLKFWPWFAFAGAYIAPDPYVGLGLSFVSFVGFLTQLYEPEKRK